MTSGADSLTEKTATSRRRKPTTGPKGRPGLQPRAVRLSDTPRATDVSRLLTVTRYPMDAVPSRARMRVSNYLTARYARLRTSGFRSMGSLSEPADVHDCVPSSPCPRGNPAR